MTVTARSTWRPNGETLRSRRFWSNVADVNPKTHKGITPLQLAVPRGHVELTRLLLEHDATMGRARPSTTLLHMAAALAHSEMLELLIERGEDVNAQDPDLNTPLHMVPRAGHEFKVKEVAVRPKTVCKPARFCLHTPATRKRRISKA